MWSVHAMEYKSPMKRNEILIRTVVWMNLEEITLREISQTKRQICGAKSGEIRSNSRTVLARAKTGDGDLQFNGKSFSFERVKQFQGWMVVTVTQQCALIPLNCLL